ncbi:uncharacterized protein TRIVIDRAFT_231559 [Trichoderma virens Gv29-8]|uniref:Nucleoside phosphorylase domain-containing protein n=1 Tax=Hypocrea virens (strain Gv29-8 / FGSC 10586) TaxID=413071 RepID=G9N3A8_HYPVG|nr:uncharacterized protein TRIVIDRAFT_231559 [Trichoderma virens Gv29-8]EHK18792.1 hypothetical protein TRIVIDRAFT_231559 [Trichoderma virens Gv29-8]UKZ56572.1 hypothetical protein TrVGV298_010410 [Trichoderma virens]
MSDSGPSKPIRRSDFEIAIVCALQIEYDAVCLLIDGFWDDEDFRRAEGDQNIYTTGHISNHNVVIILLASMGKTSAATAVANMRMSFTAIQLLLLVGICGGVPFPSGPRGEEILLGDVIIGDEVKPYDYGKQYPDGFQRSESFGYGASNFNRGIRGLLNFLKTDRGTRLLEDRISLHLQHFQEVASSCTKVKYAYPGAVEDKLFASEYRHKHHQRSPCICRGCFNDSDPVCEEAIKASCVETDCDTSCTIPRQRITAKQMLGPDMINEAQRPTIHFGRLASADMVLKSAKDRDTLSQELQVIGFEMEAAGFYNELPYIVIKSVCDYADSHKSKAWQPFAAATAASACKSLLERYHQTDPILKENSRGHKRAREDDTHSTICVIPLLKNERFVGRHDVLKELKEMLFHKQNFSRAALVGLGGIGKTQVGLQLAYLMKEVLRDENGNECSVLWIPALSMATFEQACADIARHIPRPRGMERDDKKIVKDYFSTKAAGRWLLILDNADDHDLIFGHSSAPGGLLQHLPRSDLGCILTTTRDRRVAVGFAETNVVTLSKMDINEAETFFRKSLLKKDFINADEAIRSLLEFLERMPLAIAQAAAYINVNQVTIHEFLGLLRDVPHDQISVLGRHFQDSTRYQGSQNAIAKTWLASFDKITQTDPTAAKLLVFISFIGYKGIPRSLLPKGESREEFLHAIGTLLGYGFLTLHQEDFYDMHRLVHIAATVWARERSAHTTYMNMNLALAHIASVFPYTEYEGSKEKRAYLPHALKILKGILCSKNEYSQILAALVGRFLLHEGRICESISLLEYLVAYSRMRKDDPVWLLLQRDLARAYCEDGRIKKAISILECVVPMHEKVLGEEHLETVTSRHSLVMAYVDEEQFKKATSVLTAIEEKALRTNHQDPLVSHELTSLHTWGGTDEAISILERVVAMWDKHFKDHPNHLIAQHELAIRYYKYGHKDKAILMLERVVALWGHIEHPYNVTSQLCLGRMYRQNGQIEKAIGTLERAAVIADKCFKDDTMDLMMKHENADELLIQRELAHAYYENDQPEKALPLLEDAASILRRILPEDNNLRIESEEVLARMRKSLEEGGT